MGSQTVAFSHYNNLSPKLPIDPKTGNLVGEDIQTIVESIGHVLEDVVKVNLYVTNVSDMPIVDEVYATFFKTATPARRVVGVKHVPQGALIQIDVVVENAEGTPVKSFV